MNQLQQFARQTADCASQIMFFRPSATFHTIHPKICVHLPLLICLTQSNLKKEPQPPIKLCEYHDPFNRVPRIREQKLGSWNFDSGRRRSCFSSPPYPDQKQNPQILFGLYRGSVSPQMKLQLHEVSHKSNQCRGQ